MKRFLYFALFFVALNGFAALVRTPVPTAASTPTPTPTPTPVPTPMPSSTPDDHCILPADDEDTLDYFFIVVAYRCELPANLHDALTKAIEARSADERAKSFLAGLRVDPLLRPECALSDDSLATRPMLEHPNLDACTHDARFAPDPWGTNTTFLCRIDIATYLFLDVLAAHLPAERFEPNASLQKLIAKKDRLQSLECDRAHPNFVAHAKRIKEAADAYNMDAGALYPRLF